MATDVSNNPTASILTLKVPPNSVSQQRAVVILDQTEVTCLAARNRKYICGTVRESAA
jgi:hypothetical protein